MVIYVEYVIIDNMTIDILILLLTKHFLKLKSNKLRIFLSALLGTILALLSPIFPNYINIAIKIPLALAMILIAFKISKTKQFFATILTFFSVTFLMIGSCLGIMEMLGVEYIKSNGGIYTYSFPIGLILLICAITFVCAKNITSFVFKKHSTDSLEHHVVLKLGKKIISATAFLDTGNKLERDGKTISIINFDIFSKLFPQIPLTDLLLKNQIDLPGAEYIEVKSIGGYPLKILVFEIEEIEIDKRKINRPLLALSFEHFEKGLNCEMIISNKLLGDQYETDKD